MNWKLLEAKALINAAEATRNDQQKSLKYQLLAKERITELLEALQQEKKKDGNDL